MTLNGAFPASTSSPPDASDAAAVMAVDMMQNADSVCLAPRLLFDAPKSGIPY